VRFGLRHAIFLSLAAALVLSILGAGSLSPPSNPNGTVNFTDVEALYFHSLYVTRDYGAPQSEPLLLYVHFMGDGLGTNLSAANAWLYVHYHVILVPSPTGMPYYLTRHTLLGTDGSQEVGATVPGGVVVDVHVPTLVGCALAHETGHVLGLAHAHNATDIMFARCDYDKLAYATVSPDESRTVDTLVRITSYEATGPVTWAERANPASDSSILHQAQATSDTGGSDTAPPGPWLPSWPAWPSIP
jgi:hypothetical protein